MRIAGLRAGLGEIVQLRNEVRMGPVSFKASQEVRLQRLAPRAVVRGDVLFIPVPKGEVVSGLIAFIETMWPVDP